MRAGAGNAADFEEKLADVFALVLAPQSVVVFAPLGAKSGAKSEVKARAILRSATELRPGRRSMLALRAALAAGLTPCLPKRRLLEHDHRAWCAAPAARR